MVFIGISIFSSLYYFDIQFCDDFFFIDFGVFGDCDVSLFYYLDIEICELNDLNELFIMILGFLKDFVLLLLLLFWFGVRKWLLNDDILKRLSSFFVNLYFLNCKFEGIFFKVVNFYLGE